MDIILHHLYIFLLNGDFHVPQMQELHPNNFDGSIFQSFLFFVYFMIPKISLSENAIHVKMFC